MKTGTVLYNRNNKGHYTAIYQVVNETPNGKASNVVTVPNYPSGHPLNDSFKVQVFQVTEKTRKVVGQSWNILSIADLQYPFQVKTEQDIIDAMRAENVRLYQEEQAKKEAARQEAAHALAQAKKLNPSIVINVLDQEGPRTIYTTRLEFASRGQARVVFTTTNRVEPDWDKMTEARRNGIGVNDDSQYLRTIVCIDVEVYIMAHKWDSDKFSAYAQGSTIEEALYSLLVNHD